MRPDGGVPSPTAPNITVDIPALVKLANDKACPSVAKTSRRAKHSSRRSFCHAESTHARGAGWYSTNISATATARCSTTGELKTKEESTLGVLDYILSRTLTGAVRRYLSQVRINYTPRGDNKRAGTTSTLRVDGYRCS